MTNNYLIIGGWIRSKKSYKKLIASGPTASTFIFIHHKNAMSPTEIRNFLDDKQILKTNIIGHSTGGAMAIDFALKYPGYLGKLYLVDSEGIYGSEKVIKMIFALIENNLHHGHRKLIANIYSSLIVLRHPVHSLKTAKYAHFVDFAKELKNLKVETKILWGEKDKVIPVWQGEMMSKLIKNSELVVLPKMDHDWILHRGDLFWKSI